MKNFNSYLDHIDMEIWKELCQEYGEIRQYKKGEEFVSIGEMGQYIGLVRKGSLKYVVYDSVNEEKVVALESVGGFAGSFPFCLNNDPSIFSIIATSDSIIECVPVSVFKTLKKSDIRFERFLNHSIEALFYNMYHKFIDLYALPPKERYLKLIEDFPNLFEIFRIKEIASLLNITTQHLYRIRKSLKENHLHDPQI